MSNHNTHNIESRLMDFRCKDDALEGYCILVTGAGDGIGRSVALLCAQLGAHVLLLGRTEKKLNAVYDEIETYKKNGATVIPFDLEKIEEDQYTQVANFVEQQFGKLDGLIHCASALGTIQPLHQTKAETFLAVMQTNLNSHFLLTKAMLKLLAESPNASVVFTSSGVGRQARAFWGAYSISKVAIEAMSSIWADELGEAESIRFNTLNPGATNTAMRRRAYPTEKPETNPSPSQVAWAYVYLLFNESSGLNGQQLDAQLKKA